MATSQLALRNSYNFDVYPAAILGTNFKACTVVSIMDADTAKAAGLDISALHAKVYPYLPSGTPNDPTAYDYIKFRTPAGTSIIIGSTWINSNTIELVNSVTITAVISNVLSSDLTKVRDALAQNGFNNIKLTIS